MIICRQVPVVVLAEPGEVCQLPAGGVCDGCGQVDATLIRPASLILPSSKRGSSVSLAVSRDTGAAPAAKKRQCDHSCVPILTVFNEAWRCWPPPMDKGVGVR